MPNTPYPPYPPSFTKVAEIGGYHRTCLVIDLFTLQELGAPQIAAIEDQIELLLSRIRLVDKSEVVGPHRFVKPLRVALRLE
jgi:hypothetical protein